MKKTLFLLLLFIVLGLSILHIIVSNRLSTAGVELDTVQKQLTFYRKQNLILQEDVLDNSSLFHIASAAATMGFVNEKSHVYLSAPLPLAKR